MLIALYCGGRHLVIDSVRFDANDFSPVYVAARMVGDGKIASLYDHHPYLFNLVPPGEFKETAQKVAFRGFLAPYVHLPLFAFLAQPLLLIPFSVIAVVLACINIISVLVSLYLILKLTTKTLSVRWFFIAITALAYYYPLRYGLRLGQTSPLVLLGITSLYYLAETQHGKTAGIILGGIISLKITPLLLLLYFLIQKKWQVVISGILTTAVIVTGSLLIMGWETNLIFFSNLTRLNGLSLASWNNQSVDGFLLRWDAGALHLYDWHLLPVALKMRIGKYLFLGGVLLLWLCTSGPSNRRSEADRAPLDFSFILSISILFAPIAWTHYLIFFLFPHIILASLLLRNKQIPCRTWLIGGIVVSYIGMALPPSYCLAMLNYPLLEKIPLAVLSSGGFLGSTLLLLIILICRVLVDKPGRIGSKKTVGMIATCVQETPPFRNKYCFSGLLFVFPLCCAIEYPALPAEKAWREKGSGLRCGDRA